MIKVIPKAIIEKSTTISVTNTPPPNLLDIGTKPWVKKHINATNSITKIKSTTMIGDSRSFMATVGRGLDQSSLSTFSSRISVAFVTYGFIKPITNEKTTLQIRIIDHKGKVTTCTKNTP